MPKEDWRAELTRTVPREDIPPFLVELQGLVAFLRQARDDLRIPDAAEVEPLLTDRLRAHPDLVTGYLDDERYRDIVSGLLAS